ncbi:MAG: CZB domain-containing protein, partial [candidate division Zixibacteria bacterium]|nr:CZB domain-containing protein [candidate division Zixibacteria bacterium]
NAAIEAARAGEQGRGFAVVADEVRKLAERTAKATGEITGMIKGIQGQTGSAVASMEAGIQQVDKGREHADRAGSSLNQIVTMSQQVQDMIQQIATAAEQQSVAAEEISKNMEHIAAVTKETASGAEQSASAGEQLHHQAEGLWRMVASFKVRGSRVLDVPKDDHKRYVGRLEKVVSKRLEAEAWKHTDHHHCRFGKWYYSDASRAYSDMDAFHRIEQPHEAVHRLANDAVQAVANGNDQRAAQLLKESKAASQQVIQAMERLEAEVESAVNA